VTPFPAVPNIHSNVHMYVSYHSFLYIVLFRLEHLYLIKNSLHLCTSTKVYVRYKDLSQHTNCFLRSYLNSVRNSF
jgi:hypothetical protein